LHHCLTVLLRQGELATGDFRLRNIVELLVVEFFGVVIQTVGLGLGNMDCVQERFTEHRRQMIVQGQLKHWLRLDHLQPEQGVALLLNIQPEATNLEILAEYAVKDIHEATEIVELVLLNGEFISVSPRKSEVPYLIREKALNEFRNLVELHKQWLCYWYSGQHSEKTPLAYFIDWAEAKDAEPEWLDVVKGMGWDSKNITQPPEIATLPNHDHFSDQLSFLVQASHYWWSKVDRNDPGSIPKNSDVAAWLLKRGFSERLAKSGASILRPNWVPSGRRPEE
jgi:hypothetical protein